MVFCAWAPEASITVRCIDDVSRSDPSFLKPVIAEVAPFLRGGSRCFGCKISPWLNRLLLLGPTVPSKYLQVSA